MLIRVSHQGSTSGRHLGQNRQKLNENYKINVLRGKREGEHGGQINLLSSGGNPTRGNSAHSYGRNQETM